MAPNAASPWAWEIPGHSVQQQQQLAFGSIVAAVLDSAPTNNRIWNIVANAIDIRVMAQGLSPLFSPRPVTDLG